MNDKTLFLIRGLPGQIRGARRGLGLLLLFLFVSCSDFFTHSLGEWASRDPDSLIPPVTTANVNELVRLTENDPDLSLALLKKIAASSSAGNSAMQAAALTAASNAAALGMAVVGSAGDLDEIDADKARDVVSSVIGDLDNLETTALLLMAILPASSAPEWGDFIAAAQPGDLAMAAIIILSVEAKNTGDPATFFSTFARPSVVPEEALAIELADEAALNPGDGFLLDILKGLGLVA
ncbi:MAG: hypothetical protein LBJ31_06360 [Treponema sp.]|jgi:hypothetical protein|nr:hypothetical protein [Treponema sp.]